MSDRNCDVRLLVLGASLSSTSLNNRLADIVSDICERRGATIERARIRDFDCPFYDADLEKESGTPTGAQDFAARLKASDGFVIAAPEYNASMPAAVKNLIDWASRLRPQPFNGMQALLVSASPSMVGGNRGLWALRVPLEHLGARVYPDMFSLARAHQSFDDEGRIANDALQQRLETTLDCFMDLVEATKLYPVLKKQWIEFLGEQPDAATDRVEVSDARVA
jgi:chromate reductase, NAD(P)H dehydrogenase (quinone)